MKSTINIKSEPATNKIFQQTVRKKKCSGKQMPRNVAKVALLHWKEGLIVIAVVTAVVVVVVGGGEEGGRAGGWRGRGG